MTLQPMKFVCCFLLFVSSVRCDEILSESIYFDANNKDVSKFFEKTENFVLRDNQLVLNVTNNASGSITTKYLTNPKNFFTFGVTTETKKTADFYELWLSLFDGRGPQLIHKNIKFSEIFNLTIDPFEKVSIYRAVIELKPKRAFTIDELGSNEIVLSHFFINDPCVVNVPGEFIFCTKGRFHDYKVDYMQQTCSCVCNKGYLGDTCQNIDYDINYCKQNTTTGKLFDERFCSSGNCVNRDDLHAAECTCPDEGTKFNFFLNQCLTIPKSCNAPQQIQMSDSGFSCSCGSGFVVNGTDCVSYDACNNLHRSQIGKKSISCPANTECIPVFDDETTDFQCRCSDGFVNKFGILDESTVCVAKNCTVDIFGCTQGCVDSGDACRCHPGYKRKDLLSCEPDKDTEEIIKNLNCISKTHPQPYILSGDRCSCRDGFNWNSATQQCELKEADSSDSLAQALGCKLGLEIKWQDKQLGCICREDELFDLNSRNCFLSKPNDQSCQTHNAFYDKTTGKCQCESDELIEAIGNSWRCINKCQLLDSAEFLKSHRCDKNREYCDASKLQIDPSTHAVLNNSQKFCFCADGFFEQQDGHCVPNKTPEQLVLVEMFFEFASTKSSAPKTQAREAFVKLVKTVLKHDEPPRDVVCNYLPNKTMVCAARVVSQFAKQSNIDAEHVKKLFLEHSHQFGSEIGYLLSLEDSTKIFMKTSVSKLSIVFAN